MIYRITKTPSAYVRGIRENLPCKKERDAIKCVIAQVKAGLNAACWRGMSQFAPLRTYEFLHSGRSNIEDVQNRRV